MNNLNKDRTFALCSAALAVYLGIESFAYPGDSSFFPRVLSVLLGCLALVMFSRLSLKARKISSASAVSLKSNGDPQSALGPLKSAGFVFLSIIAYGLVMLVVNYEVATAGFLILMIYILGFRKPIITLGISVGLTLLLYSIFFNLLGVSRPESLFLY